MKIINKIKENLKYYPKINLNRIKIEIDKYDYVSFDMFDTLIKRDLNKPSDLFYVMEEIVDLKKSFHNDRIKAEEIARNETNNEEIKIDDIYNVLSKKYDYSKNECDLLKHKEIEFEIDNCTKSKTMYDIYQYCLDKNKKIIIISNMYLPKKTIELILYKNGFYNYDRLYVSSDINRRKDKSLFKYVLEDLNIDSKRMIHIGDSYKEDKKSANSNGIKSILIANKINNLLIKKSNKYEFNNEVLLSFINNRIDNQKNYYNKIGYQCYGKLLYGFSLWLKNMIMEKEIKEIYFLSRDGFIIKRAFDLINADTTIHTHYLEVSRRSTRVPMLWIDLSIEKIYKSFPAATLTNIEVFFDTIGLEINNYEALLKEVGLDKNYSFKKEEILTDDKINKLYKKIESDIISNSKKEYRLLVDYLNQEIKKEKIAIVDIGWRGSMQLFIEKILENENSKKKIIGYYFGLTKESLKYKKDIEEYGYIFDFFNNELEIDPRGGYVGLFESLFMKNIGSIKKYKNNNNFIEPVYYDNEYYNDDGVLFPEINNIIDIQNGAIDFINDYSKKKYKTISKIKLQSLYADIHKIGAYPTNEIVEKLSNVKFFDGKIQSLAEPKSFLYYLKKPKILIKDFYDSRWKIGFLKKLFKIKLPYYKIYKLLKHEK